MQLFLDSAKLDEIRHALDYWDMDGLTTNPRHVQAAGKPFLQTIEEIARLVEGTSKPVSVEVNPHLADWEQIVEEGIHLAGISPNFVIKVGASEPGFRAIRELTRRGIRTNATLIFSTAQAWHAARAGATYVSPFVGWKDQYGEATADFVPEVLSMLEVNDYPTQVIVAAVRNARQVAEAAIAGAHCCTAGLAVWQDTFRSPYTDMGEKIFTQAWDGTPKE